MSSSSASPTLLTLPLTLLALLAACASAQQLATNNGDLIAGLSSGNVLRWQTLGATGNVLSDNVVATLSDVSQLSSQINTVVGQLQTAQSSSTAALSSSINGLASQVSSNIIGQIATFSTAASSATVAATNSLSSAISTQLALKATTANVSAQVSALNSSLLATVSTDLLSVATSNQLSNVKASLTTTWPNLASFAAGTLGWTATGANIAVTTCGSWNVLGGYGVLGGGATISKTFTLPYHQGMRLHLYFFALDNWTGQSATISVDGNAKWTKTFNTSVVATLGNLCGNPAYPDNLFLVELDLLDHTATSATISITSTLTATAGTASFGISNFDLSYVAPTWPAPDNFNYGDTLNWNSNITYCGLYGNIMGGYLGSSSPVTLLYKAFNNLPSHTNLQLQLNLYFIDGPWPAGSYVKIAIDGIVVWTGTQASSSVSQCGSATVPDSWTPVAVTLDPHVSTNANVTISVVLPSGTNPFLTFGVSDVQLATGVPYWPVQETFAPNDYSSNTAANWYGSTNAISSCGSVGYILGGYQILGQNSYVEKTFRNLPSHSGLTVSFTVVFGDSWPAYEVVQVYAHGQLVASLSTSAANSTANYCGLPATDAVLSVNIPLPTHVAPSLVLRFASNLTSNSSVAWYGITNVGVGQYTPVWPSLDTFAGLNGQYDGWSVTGATLALTSCGGFGGILGGYETFGTGAVAYKTYSNLPAHTGLTIQFYAIFIDGWQGESYLVYADGQLIYSQSNYGNSAHSFEACGLSVTGQDYERRDSVSVTIPHTASSVTLTFTTTLTEPLTGSTSASWGLDNVLVGPALILNYPPSDLFEQGVDGWTGNASYPSTCGVYGNILGGGFFGNNTYVQKQFLMPPHVGLYIEFTSFFLGANNWLSTDTAFVAVDGTIVGQYTNGGGAITTACSGTLNDRRVFQYIDLAGHTNSYADVRIWTNATVSAYGLTKSFAIDDFRIMPYV